MATPTPTLWNDIISQVRLTEPALVRGWFVDLSLGGVDQGVVEVLAQNRAQARYLSEYCQQAFAEAAQAATGRLVSVVFRSLADDHDESDGNSWSVPQDEQLQLNPDYTFDHFVTGPCNRLAYAAAQAVAEDPGRSYNPLFIHGPVGLGKTHLLQGICHATRISRPRAVYSYISCETFINHLIQAVENGVLHHLRYRYRHVDGLIIDDIQFLAERERSQEEFFHTFNALHQSQKQIVLSADCSPSEIPSLEERLVSRFNSGLVALLDQPCLETRMAIVRKKAKLRCIEVPEDVIQLIATRVDSNIRELEGALVKLDALSQTLGTPIALELARQALGSAPMRPVSIPQILEAVAQRYNVKVVEIQSKKRSKVITQPRHICMYLARQLTSQSLQQIGGYFGGRDHSTVLHASRAIAEQLQADSQLQAVIDEVATEIKSAPL